MAGNSSHFLARKGSISAKPALLAGLGWIERVRALAVSLKIAGPDEVDSIGLALVGALGSEWREWGSGLPRPWRGWVEGLEARWCARAVREARADGLRELVQAWGRLSSGVRAAALPLLQNEGVGLAGGLASDANAEVRASVIRFIGDCGEARLFEVVLAAILDDDGRVGAAAEETLIHVVERVTGESLAEFGVKARHEWASSSRVELSEEDRADLRARLAELCRSFAEHRRKGVLAAAVGMLDGSGRADGGLGAWLSEDSQASHPAVKSMLRRGVGAVSRRRAWEWLVRPSVAGAAEDRLGRAETAEEFGVVLELSHLIEHPRRRQRAELVMSRRRGAMIPNAEMVPELSVGARRGLWRMLDERRGDEVERIMAPLLTDEDDAARLTAVRVLPAAGVLDYCFDKRAEVAAAAAVKWWYGSGADARERARVARNLARSPHERVRWMGEQWSEAGDGEGAIERLRMAIRSGGIEEKLGAIAEARRRGLQRDVELELMGLVGMSDELREERVVGAAVAALGESGSNSAWEVVEACLSHVLPRVRANAAEAMVKRSLGRGDLAAQSPRLYDSLIEMKSDESHRVRSSAVRAMLRAASPDWGGTGFEPAAAEELVKMLEDERPMHRLAGLWAVEHAARGESVDRRWDRIATRVAKLAREETDDAVQRRAVWCARRMLAVVDAMQETDP